MSIDIGFITYIKFQQTYHYRDYNQLMCLTIFAYVENSFFHGIFECVTGSYLIIPCIIHMYLTILHLI